MFQNHHFMSEILITSSTFLEVLPSSSDNFVRPSVRLYARPSLRMSVRAVVTLVNGKTRGLWFSRTNLLMDSIIIPPEKLKGLREMSP